MKSRILPLVFLSVAVICQAKSFGKPLEEPPPSPPLLTETLIVKSIEVSWGSKGDSKKIDRHLDIRVGSRLSMTEVVRRIVGSYEYTNSSGLKDSDGRPPFGPVQIAIVMKRH